MSPAAAKASAPEFTNMCCESSSSPSQNPHPNQNELNCVTTLSRKIIGCPLCGGACPDQIETVPRFSGSFLIRKDPPD
jgi:hypothetical protein